MGPTVELEFKRPGFFPAGGGRFHARIQPVTKLSTIALLERGSIRSRRARVWTSKLPEHVAERELAVVREELKWRADECSVENVPHPMGPGNAVVLEIEAEHVTAVFTGFWRAWPARRGSGQIGSRSRQGMAQGERACG